jgi:hypothetical protein
VDATGAGRGHGDSTSERGGHRGNGYEQPLLLSGNTPDVTMLASMAVATLRGAALLSATVRTAGRVVTAGPEVGEAVFFVTGFDAMILAGH